jgi:hypothetical protein
MSIPADFSNSTLVVYNMIYELKGQYFTADDMLLTEQEAGHGCDKPGENGTWDEH